MQEQNELIMETVLFPIPAELLEELCLEPGDAVQMSISGGRLIIEPIDDEASKICCGCCARRRGYRMCKDRCR